MTVARLVASVVLAAALFGAAPGVAGAQSPPPFGFWITPDGQGQLLIGRDANCSLADGFGMPISAGQCSWNATHGGGILTIMSVMTRVPAPVYLNVVWVDARTIRVEGATYYLQ